jgi:hypothetical protein
MTTQPGPLYGKDLFGREITTTASRTLLDVIAEMPKISAREEFIILVHPDDLDALFDLCCEHGAVVKRLYSWNYEIRWHQALGDDFVDEVWPWCMMKRNSAFVIHRSFNESYNRQSRPGATGCF